MELTKFEVAAVQEVAAKVDAEIRELRELELSLVGGGCGEVVFG